MWKKKVLATLVAFAVFLPMALAIDDAMMQEYTIYQTPLDVGIRYTVGVGFKNTGDSVWSKAAGYQMVIKEGIGSYCTGTELSSDDSIAGGQIKEFELSCIPLKEDMGKTTLRLQLQLEEVSFGEEGVIDVLSVEDNCNNNAVDRVCNKYCGAQEECHGFTQNYINENGFCDEQCMFSESPPEGFLTTTTMPTTTTRKTTTTSTTTTTTTTTETTTTTIKCTLTEGLREDGVCAIACGASADCNLKTVLAKGCLNCGARLCGDGVVDEAEQCDTSAEQKEWKCEPLVCNGSRSKGFSTCRQCQCAYYDETCSRARCEAACENDTQCDDNNSNTGDSCNLSSCSCYHAPIQRTEKNESIAGREEITPTRSSGVKVFIVIALCACAVAFIFIRKRGKKHSVSPQEPPETAP